MKNNNMEIVLESLAETIRSLQVDIICLKAENERLNEELERKEKDNG